jgi:hypothetical protein
VESSGTPWAETEDVVTTSVLEDIMVSTERRTWFLYEYLKETDESWRRLVLVDELCKKQYENSHLPSATNWPCEFVYEMQWVLPAK